MIRRRRRLPLGLPRSGREKGFREMTNVAIIGGGCAGLGAAATLLQTSNAKVWLFEALGRLGGRTLTCSEALPVDLGAEALEEAGSNPWVRIADDLGVATVPVEQTTVYRVFQEQAWTSEGNTPGIELVDAALLEGYTTRRASPNLPIIGSLKHWDDTTPQMVSLALASSPYGPIKESAEPWQFLASDMYRQEQLAPDDDSDPQFVTGGVGALVAQYAASLQEQFGERFQVKLNAPVGAVNCRNGNVTLLTGDVFLSDYCIVTAPVGTILQIAFTPPFSGERIAAYRSLKLGSYKKVGFRPTTAPTEGNAIQPGNLYYVYDPEQFGSWQYSWLPTDETILVCVTSGNFAARLDRMPDRDVLQRLVELLTLAHPNGVFTPQNGPDDQPAVAISNWSNQPYIGGAYSYTSYDGGPADDPAPLDARKRIAAPHLRAYFAGEATYPDNYGTIAGAYISGGNAAAKLIQERGLPAAGQQ